MSEELENKIEDTTVETTASEFPRTNSNASFLEKAGAFFQGKAKVLAIVGGAIVVVLLGWLGYQKFVVEPEDIKSAEAIYQAEAQIIDTQNWKAAIEGDSLGTFVGLQALAKKHEGYAGGDIAAYDLGIAYLNNNQPKEALAALESVSFDDENIETMRIGAMGDACADLGDYAKAEAFYQEAYDRRPKNEMTAPLYMMKLADVKEFLNKYSEAETLYRDLIENFPNNQFKTEAEKNLVFVSAGTSIYVLK